MSTETHAACPKCKSTATRVVGRSLNPPCLYIACSACGYSTSIEAPAVPPTPQANLDTQRIEQIARRALQEFDATMTLVRVEKDQDAWSVLVKKDERSVVKVPVKQGTAVAIRTAILDGVARA